MKIPSLRPSHPFGLGLLVPALLAVVSHAALADGYAIASLNGGPSPTLVPSSGDGSVRLQIAGPSTALILRSAVLLNGHNVTSALQPDGGVGTMTGTVTGLQPGDNLIQLFDSKTSKTPQAQLRVSKALQPAIPCTSMLGMNIPAAAIGLPTGGATITAATLVPATPANTSFTNLAPEHCSIVGSILPADPNSIVIRFGVAIPTEWNQKSFQIGGGGNNGVIPAAITNPGNRSGSPFGGQYPVTAPAIIYLGYALYGGDSGHSSANGNSWIDNPAFPILSESFQNFTSDGIKKTHDTALAVMNLMYGKRPAINYWAGQSQGGREGLIALTRYAADYDGIFSGDFLAYFSNLNFNPQLQGALQLNAGAWVPSAKAAALKAEVLRQCDGLDGLTDGIIQNYAGCAALFDPTTHPTALAALRCTGAETNACLTDMHIATLTGPAFLGAVPYSYPLKDSETSYPGWGPLEGLSLLVSTQPVLANGTTFTGAGGGGLGISVVREYFCSSQTCNVLQVFSDLNAQQQKIQVLSEAVDVSADWSGFRARGGKVILNTSAADTISNPRAQHKLYNNVVSRFGQSAVDQFVRYYVSPMTVHGGNGSGGAVVPTAADLLNPLINWTENNVVPPDAPLQMRITTSGTGSATQYTIAQSRPLCRYPTYPQYTGSGDPAVAASYTCASPAAAVRTSKAGVHQ